MERDSEILLKKAVEELRNKLNALGSNIQSGETEGMVQSSKEQEISMRELIRALEDGILLKG